MHVNRYLVAIIAALVLGIVGALAYKFGVDSSANSNGLVNAAPPVEPANAQSTEGSAVASGANVATEARSSVEPSFDCGQSSSNVERMICSDSELAGLDARLAALYGEARRNATRRAMALTGQRAFLSRRNQCEDRQCVAFAYRDWIDRIGEVTQPNTLISRWTDENDRCRGGSGDEPETLQACDRRDLLDEQLTNESWCLRFPGESWHRC